MFDRRRLLKTLLAGGVSSALPFVSLHAQPRFAAYPFGLGVASGYPSPSSVVLWTRLLGDLGPSAVTVRWELAGDEGFRQIAASGSAEASPAWAHSARVEVRGLASERPYWYRFHAGDAQSPVGRTRTAPSADAKTEKLRFAFASCQQYEQGWYGAYRHIVADQPDLVAFLGDYIYESSWGRDHVRSHGAPETHTLEEYRARYALYKSDPDLQAAHAACPWIVTWDDHEVVNDYSDDRAINNLDRDRFLARRAAAYQAYFEHMPLPPSMAPSGPALRLHTDIGWGQLARFFMLDDRQYRSWHACPRPGRRAGANFVDIDDCPRLASPGRSMLGRAQERWLEQGLERSQAAWNVLAQQTVMAQVDRKPGPGRIAWTDGWDGYPAARKRLLDFLPQKKIQNPIILGGDVHTFTVADLKPDFDDAASPAVASEFVTTSITSQGGSQNQQDALRAENPHLLLSDTRFRGYVRVEVTPKLWRADLRALDSEKRRDTACSTLASFAVESGKPGPVKM
jgi:alkaline phosphatase D